jgi:hypothetical protein
MTTVVVEFDGTNFVPQQPVHLPVGTRATVAIDDRAAPDTSVGAVPDAREWEAMLQQIRATPPHPPTVEEAMRQIRMRP